jgi:N-methylhydantoinase B/oxoprolinase/acetone carboxylase alpha subunit
MADLGEIELIEDEIALVGLTYRRLMRDNQGFGRYRGGHGHLQVATYQNSPLWGWQTITIGSKFPQAFGLFGGYGSPCYPLMKVKGVDALEAMRADPSIEVTDPVAVMNNRPFADAEYTTSHTGLQFELAQPGELYMASQGTGGGYGDVLERKPEAVVRDLRRGLISEWTARHIYAVAADPETFALDLRETERLRAETRAERLTNGVPFAEFEARWTTKTPPEGMPYYGSWDDPEVIYAGDPATTMPADAIQAVMMM